MCIILRRFIAEASLRRFGPQNQVVPSCCKQALTSKKWSVSIMLMPAAFNLLLYSRFTSASGEAATVGDEAAIVGDVW